MSAGAIASVLLLVLIALLLIRPGWTVSSRTIVTPEGITYAESTWLARGGGSILLWKQEFNVIRGPEGTVALDPVVTLTELAPLWLLWLAGAGCVPLPLFWLHRLRRAHVRRRDNLCRVCGYDLRATPDRCPECGSLARLPRQPGV